MDNEHRRKQETGERVSRAKQGFPILLVLCAMAITAMQSSTNAIAGVLNDYASFYGVDFASFSTVSTISLLVALPTLLCANTLIRKLGLKTCCIISAAGLMITGVLPSFIPLSFEGLLVVRGAFGVFFGLAVPLGITVATYYFEDEGLRASVIGWSMALASIFNIVFNMGGSLLASIQLQWVWLIYFVLILQVALALTMPKPPSRTQKTTRFGCCQRF